MSFINTYSGVAASRVLVPAAGMRLQPPAPTLHCVRYFI
jgi:hypothetical protein